MSVCPPRRVLFGACVLVVVLLASGCKRRAAPAAGTSPLPPIVAVMPAGYVEARVLDVVDTSSGATVYLVVDAEGLVLPMLVGGTEATTIDLRASGKHYVRPLTHDLLSDTIRELGGRAVKVQVDELRANTFIGSVFLERPDGTVATLDARPSDCIALALGAKIPIYLKHSVLVEAGVPISSLGGGRGPRL
jgi:bifunctional DNase/RNase